MLVKHDTWTQKFLQLQIPISTRHWDTRRANHHMIEDSLPPEVRDKAHFFREDAKHELPPYRLAIDIKIELIKDENGREEDIPITPLHDMSSKELLVLR